MFCKFCGADIKDETVCPACGKRADDIADDEKLSSIRKKALRVFILCIALCLFSVGMLIWLLTRSA